MSLVAVLSIIGLLVVVILLAIVAASRYKKVGAQEAMILTGKGDPKIIIGGGKFVLPVIYQYSTLSLSANTVQVHRENIYTKNRVPIVVDAVLVYKVKGEEDSVKLAAQAFLGKSDRDISELIEKVAEGAFRDICGKMTPEEINENRERFQNEVTTTAQGHFDKMGTDLLSFVVTHITDQNDYFKNLGRPASVEVEKEARIKTAEANKMATVVEAVQRFEGAKKNAEADADIALANKERDVKRATYNATVSEENAKAEQAGPRAEATAKKDVATAQKDLAIVEAERKEKELLASIIKPAEAEKQSKIISAEGEKKTIELKAEADQYKQTQEGQGEAARKKSVGQAEADVIRLKGTAEADVIKLKLLAEAEGWEKRAEAMKKYNDAGMALELGQRYIDKMPAMIEAASKALGAVDKIEIFDFGGGQGNPAGKVMGMAPQNVIQTLTWLKEATGIDLAGMLKGAQNKLNESRAGAVVEEKPLPREEGQIKQ